MCPLRGHPRDRRISEAPSRSALCTRPIWLNIAMHLYYLFIDRYTQTHTNVIRMEGMCESNPKGNSHRVLDTQHHLNPLTPALHFSEGAQAGEGDGQALSTKAKESQRGCPCASSCPCVWAAGESPTTPRASEPLADPKGDRMNPERHPNARRDSHSVPTTGCHQPPLPPLPLQPCLGPAVSSSRRDHVHACIFSTLYRTNACSSLHSQDDIANE